MHECAFLTLDDPTGFVMDDDLAVEPFLARGWRVVAVPWRQTARRWSSFDAVVIRSTWDYPRDVGGFLAVLEEIATTIQAARPDDALRRAGDAVLAALPDTPLYARVDLVRANGGGGFWLMELELVEPSLYLRLDPADATRFADAFCRRVSTS